MLRPSRRKILFVVAAVVAYTALFPLLFGATGPAAGSLGALPVLLAAWCGGHRWGVGMAVFIGTVLNFPLYMLWMPEMSALQHLAGGGPVTVVFSLFGYGLGRLRVLSAALRASEARYRVSEARYRGVVETVRDVVCQTDRAGCWTFLNPAWEALSGFSVEKSLGRPFYEHLHPDDRAVQIAAFRALMDGEVPFLRLGSRLVHRDGRVRHVEMHVHPQRGGDNMRLGMAGSLTDLSDSVRFEAEREARERSEEMLRLKTVFLNTMSHELRTPLTGILGFAEVLAEEVEGEQAEFARLIGRNGHRLLETLDSVLDFAQLEGAKGRLARVPVDVGEVVAESAELLRAQATAKGIGLSVRREATPVRVLGDAAALGRVATNLLANAVKFTERGRVTASVYREGEGEEACVVLRVEDTGIGIEEAFLSVLFEPFRQESEGEARRYEGNGLGLAIARGLVERLGGRITVASEKGRGSTLTVRLPSAGADETSLDASRTGRAVPC